jgi:probable H4MPT-linked C1 transfer pathway protein
MSRAVVGWDIGGVNTKVARAAEGKVLAARSYPYEIQHDPDALAPLLRTLAREIGGGAGDGDSHAVTMTAELSQRFRTKRDGVLTVLRAVCSAFPTGAIHVFTVDGCFIAPELAREHPMAVAASNWAATAAIVARKCADAVLIDTGTTTTDIVPIAGGAVAARGHTDPERLRCGELVYLGALRTPVEAIVHEVPLLGDMAGVSAEGFAIAGDVHLWRGDLDPANYTVRSPDGRPASREFARERLARVVCGDRELLDDAAISAIADHVAEREEARIAESIARVLGAHPRLTRAVVAGLGAFLAARAARRAGLEVTFLSDLLGRDAARSAPAAAVALLLAEQLAGSPPRGV